MKPQPTHWKREFSVNEFIPIKGHGFYIAAINKRGLTLRKVKQEKPREESPVSSK